MSTITLQPIYALAIGGGVALCQAPDDIGLPVFPLAIGGCASLALVEDIGLPIWPMAIGGAAALSGGDLADGDPTFEEDPFYVMAMGGSLAFAKAFVELPDGSGGVGGETAVLSFPPDGQAQRGGSVSGCYALGGSAESQAQA